jgi:hypothetical protein
VGSAEEQAAEDRKEQRRVRSEAIALYTELTVVYKELTDTGHPERAARLVPDIDRVREILALLPDFRATP